MRTKTILPWRQAHLWFPDAVSATVALGSPGLRHNRGEPERSEPGLGQTQEAGGRRQSKPSQCRSASWRISGMAPASLSHYSQSLPRLNWSSSWKGAGCHSVVSFAVRASVTPVNGSVERMWAVGALSKVSIPEFWIKLTVELSVTSSHSNKASQMLWFSYYFLNIFPL